MGLDEFLNRVKATYYKLHPYEIHFDPDASTERIKVEYVPYDPTPSVIKNRTDTSLALFKEINETIITTEALKHRERKALAKVKHFLQHVFGQPYDVNYYAGDWMLGPNKRCIQQICDLGKAVYNGLGVHHKPNNASDVELIETKLKTYNTSILQYMENMKMGVHKGMVRTVEECKAGSKTINTRYLNVFLNGSRGKEMLFFFLLRLPINLPLCVVVSASNTRCYARSLDGRCCSCNLPVLAGIYGYSTEMPYIAC